MKKRIAVLLLIALLTSMVCVAEEIEITDAIDAADEIEIEGALIDESSDEMDVILDDVNVENDSLLELPDLTSELFVPEEASIAATVTNGVPSGAPSRDGHSYMVYSIDSIRSWDAARQYCEQMGGYLATITSEEENNFVYYDVLMKSEYTSAYFGLTDEREEGVWEWVTGEPVKYLNWSWGEPNDEYGYEDYAMYYWEYTNGTWNDGSFSDRTGNAGFNFICEWGDYSTYSYPITIGNVNESADNYATFNESLEQYIMNMDSNKYYPDLSYMLMALAAAAYITPGVGNGQLTAEKDGYASDSKALYHITKAFSDLGFTDYQPFNYFSDPNASGYGSDNAAFTIGRKTLDNGEALVLIVVRGSYGEFFSSASDWRSNLRLDIEASGRHCGFATAADKVYNQVMSWLQSRYRNNFIKSNIRYVITGHSRGAAVANLLAVRLHDAGVPNSKVYDYNFACPDTVRGVALDDLSRDHKNIWNINNTADVVGVIPGVVGDHLDYVISKAVGLFSNWNKYGTTFFYCNNWDKAAEFDLARTISPNSSHDFAKYVRDLSKRPTKFYNWIDVVKRRIKLGVDDAMSAIMPTAYPEYAATSLVMASIKVEDQVYTGKALKPAVTVKYNNITLRKGKDYTLAYKNNKSIGTATITVTGKGKYAGKRTVSFKINPKSVTGLKLKAGSKKIKVTWKNAKGVSGYQIQYALKKTFLEAQEQWVNKASSKESVILGLKKGKTYYVRIRACKKVNGEEYWSAWSSAKKVKVK